MLSNILNQSLWLDEATSILAARDLNFGEIITKFSPGDFHPPLYYFLLKIWISSFGASEAAARMPSVLFGLATVYLVYLIGSKLFSKKVGILSASLLLTAPLHFYYMLEARMYSMETFLATLLVWLFIQRKWLYFTFTGALLAYTDYLPLLVFIPLFIAAKNDKKLLTKLLKSSLGVALLLLPWLPTFVTQLQTGIQVKENAPLWWKTLGKTNGKQLLLVPIKFMMGRITFSNKGIYAVFVLFYFAAFAAPFVNAVKYLSKTKFVLYWLIVPLIGASLMGILMSGFAYFRLLFLLPAFYILIACGIASAKPNLQKLFASLLIFLNTLAIGIYLTNPRLHKEDWREAVHYVEQNSNGNAASVFVTNNQRDPYIYYSKSVPSSGPQLLDNVSVQKLWFFRYVQPIFDPEEKVKAKIEGLGYTKAKEHDFNGIVVWEYTK
ncbi:MAG: glycosyltransferase family 39 protein [bacterium]|nr:glycosyltransferase family 39 protein [bacterium]